MQVNNNGGHDDTTRIRARQRSRMFRVLSALEEHADGDRRILGTTPALLAEWTGLPPHLASQALLRLAARTTASLPHERPSITLAGEGIPWTIQLDAPPTRAVAAPEPSEFNPRRGL